LDKKLFTKLNAEINYLEYLDIKHKIENKNTNMLELEIEIEIEIEIEKLNNEF